MFSRQAMQSFFQQTCAEERDNWVVGGDLTPRAEALVLSALFAECPHNARWQLTDGREVRIFYGAGDVTEVTLRDQGHITKRWGLPGCLSPERFVSAVERFIRQARCL